MPFNHNPTNQKPDKINEINKKTEAEGKKYLKTVIFFLNSETGIRLY